jgi:hypothetical protein
MKKTAITLSILLLLSSPIKASAFDLGGDGIGTFDFGAILSKLDFYSQIGKMALNVIQNKSLDSLLNALPGLLGKLDVNGLAECSDPSIDCQGLLGDAGGVDWEKAYETIKDSVYASTKDADALGTGNASAISPGITDVRFRPRITTQLDNTKIATWTKVQNAQYQAITGVEGQKATKEGRDAVSKVVEESIKTAGEIQKLDNTQDIEKKKGLLDTYSISLQQRQILEQEQSKFAQYDGNQTANEQLSIQQKAAWEDEVRQSQSLLSASAEGDAFSDFITSAYESP